jgi:hypothetical protein
LNGNRGDNNNKYKYCRRDKREARSGELNELLVFYVFVFNVVGLW